MSRIDFQGLLSYFRISIEGAMFIHFSPKSAKGVRLFLGMCLFRTIEIFVDHDLHTAGMSDPWGQGGGLFADQLTLSQLFFGGGAY